MNKIILINTIILFKFFIFNDAKTIGSYENLKIIDEYKNLEQQNKQLKKQIKELLPKKEIVN